MFGYHLETIHPLFVHFPIALLSTGWLFDLLGSYFQKESLQHAGWWCQVSGIISMVFTIITGILADTVTGHMATPFPLYSTHGVVQITASILFVSLFVWRWRLNSELPRKLSLYIYLLVGGIAVIMLFYGGHLGAKLAGRI